MYAIFEDGSHQYRVRAGDQLVLDRRPGPRGEEVVFTKVLLITGEAGPTIGAPLIEGARVTGQIIEQFRDKKIIVQKFRRRKTCVVAAAIARCRLGCKLPECIRRLE